MKLLISGLLVSSLLVSLAQASDTSKVAIKGNMNLTYNVLPQSVSTLNDAFKDGIVYARLRSNTFYWDWGKETSNDHKLMGIGGSIIYKTAPLNGFSLTTGFYTSQVPGFMQMDITEVGDAKAGKDTFSRNNGNDGLSVIGQAYLEANRGKTTAKIGRQLVHTVFTASNDTKMIPNTFDGITMTNKSLPKTTISAAYLTAQKLRDHTSSHDVLAYDGYNENDDSGVNRSLTSTDQATGHNIGTNNKLLIASITTKLHKNHTHKLSIASVPDVFTTAIWETNYTFKLDNGLKVIPAIRYINQQDNLNSTKDVASLKGTSLNLGYTNPYSLDAGALMAKIDIKKDAWKLRLGYSKIDDKADLIAPWRGFPTGGYTRAMAQYNWYANTKTYMIRADYDFGKAGIAKGLTGLIRYAVQDFDDNKDLVQADSNVIHFDIAKELSSDMYIKLRVGLVDADLNNTSKSDVSYNEYRLELNYLF